MVSDPNRRLSAIRTLEVARHIKAEAIGLGLSGTENLYAQASSDLHRRYLESVTHEGLKAATEKLYIDQHYSSAVEQAFKYLNDAVRKKSGHSDDGTALMQTVFSPKKPKLKLNRLKTRNHENEQQGYMELFTGSIRGVRNPRAHDHQKEDTADDALELLVLANHLCRKLETCTKSRRTK